MSSLRLSDSVNVIQTSNGVILKSDFETLELTGEDTKVFVSAMIPLLDGTRDLDAIVHELGSYKHSSVASFLQLLTQKGLLEEVATTSFHNSALEGQWRFFKQWSNDPSDLMESLQQSHVLVIGLEPWGAIAAMELAASGVGHLTVWDDRTVDDGDLLAVRFWDKTSKGVPRTTALKHSIEQFAPNCEIICLNPGRTEAGEPYLPKDDDDTIDLVLLGINLDNIRDALSVTRYCQAGSIRALHCGIDGLDAILGPVFVPGESACFNCYRLRALANERDTNANLDLDQILRMKPAARRAHTYLAPMAATPGQLAALEAVKLLTGYIASGLVGRVHVQSLLSHHSSQHSVLRMPWCEICGGAASTEERNDNSSGDPDSSGSGSTGTVRMDGGSKSMGSIEANKTGDHSTNASGHDRVISTEPSVVGDLSQISDPQHLREALSPWVDTRTGVIQHLVLNTPDALQPELPITATAVTGQFTEGEHGQESDDLASGKGLTVTEALLGATGEALERYSAARFRMSKIRHCPAKHLEGSWLDPRKLNLYSDEQYAQSGFPYNPYTPDTPIHWVKGTWGDTGKSVWVPALVSYFNFQPHPSERFCQVTSNGLAAGPTSNQAALGALFELIERDAFMLTWLAKRSSPRIKLTGELPEQIKEVKRLLEQEGADLRLYLLDVGTTIPTVLCIGFGDGKRWPGATVSLACHSDSKKALQKAILEQGHLGPYIKRLMIENKHPVPGTPGQVKGLIDHALYYIPAERKRAFAFLDEGNITVSADELPMDADQSLQSISKRLTAAGLRPVIVDVTAPDLKDSPFQVARAVGTDAQQIYFGHHLQRLNNPRLNELTQEINTEPHPVA